MTAPLPPLPSTATTAVAVLRSTATAHCQGGSLEPLAVGSRSASDSLSARTHCQTGVAVNLSKDGNG